MDMTTAAKAERKRLRADRKYRRELLREKGRTPSKAEYVYRIEVDVIWMPDWARARNIPDLTAGRDFVWLRDRKLAQHVARMDRDEGGLPKLDRYAFKRCNVCGMARLGTLANARRRLNESAQDGRLKPCSPDCMVRYHQQRGNAA